VMGGDDAQPPARGAAVLRVRIRQDGVAWADREQGHEVVGEGGIDVVCQDDEIRALLDNIGDLARAGCADLHRWRVARIDHEERLDGGIRELVEFGIGVLPAAVGIRVYADFHEFVVVQDGDLDVGREDRHADGDLSPAASSRFTRIVSKT